jgi:hypothetical protein
MWDEPKNCIFGKWFIRLRAGNWLILRLGYPEESCIRSSQDEILVDEFISI